MKKYRCPYCKENTFSFWSKLTAGGMASKGKVCPECGKRAVHGLYSTIFRSVLMAAVAIFILLNCYCFYVSKVTCLIVLIAGYLICKLANGFVFELEINNRKDL